MLRQDGLPSRKEEGQVGERDGERVEDNGDPREGEHAVVLDAAAIDHVVHSQVADLVAAAVVKGLAAEDLPVHAVV